GRQGGRTVSTLKSNTEVARAKRFFVKEPHQVCFTYGKFRAQGCANRARGKLLLMQDPRPNDRVVFDPKLERQVPRVPYCERNHRQTQSCDGKLRFKVVPFLSFVWLPRKLVEVRLER